MVAPHMIKEHMEVIGSDNVHVGTVDHMEGADELQLTRLKKRKLLLKDHIARLESKLIPDLDA